MGIPLKINENKLKQFLIGKSYISLDECVEDQKLRLSVTARGKVSNILIKLGWVKSQKVLNGRSKTVWARKAKIDTLPLKIRSMELMLVKQEQDMDSLKRMLNMGFSHDQTMKYLLTFYGAEIEILDTFKGDIRDANNFGDRMELISDTIPEADKLIGATAFCFYITKYHAELTVEEDFMQRKRFLQSKLRVDKKDSANIIEWKALSHYPHFLDLAVKFPLYGDSENFVNYLVKEYVTKETLERFSLLEDDFSNIPALCEVCRFVDREIPIDLIVGKTEEEIEEMVNYAKHCKEANGKN